MDREEWETTHQHFEEGWWGDCANTYGEETKQIAYARVMGLDVGTWQGGDKWPAYDLRHASILDIGGGPVSMLLKTRFARGVVVDPCDYPAWTNQRYAAHGIDVVRMPAEDYLKEFVDDDAFDEAWCYNVLQHVIDPEALVRGMRRVARVVRLFEWVDTEAYLGHPHVLRVDELREWCGGAGTEVLLDEQYLPTEHVTPEMGWRVEQRAWGGVFR